LYFNQEDAEDLIRDLAMKRRDNSKVSSLDMCVATDSDPKSASFAAALKIAVQNREKFS
jgi:hypothetical protein